MKEKEAKQPKIQILNKGNSKVIKLTKESQGTMYYRSQ